MRGNTTASSPGVAGSAARVRIENSGFRRRRASDYAQSTAQSSARRGAWPPGGGPSTPTPSLRGAGERAESPREGDGGARGSRAAREPPLQEVRTPSADRKLTVNKVPQDYAGYPSWREGVMDEMMQILPLDSEATSLYLE